MIINKQIMTESKCYKTGQKITPKGIVFHSTATPNVFAKDWFSRWNNDYTTLGVHFFVDDTSIYQYLPCEKGNVHRAWHVGTGTKGSYNSSHIAVELCEPKDKFNNPTYLKNAYANLLDLYEYLCRTFNLPASAIVGHCEAYQLGYASNHADPNHYLPPMGYTLDKFRAEIATRLKKTTYTQPMIKVIGANGSTGSSGSSSSSSALVKGDKGDAVKALQTDLKYIGYDIDVDGSFGSQTETIVKKFQTDNKLTVDGKFGEKSSAKLDELVSAKKDKETAEEAQKAIKYRVRLSAKDSASQIGAFVNLENAKEVADKNPDYAVYDTSGNLVYQYKPAQPTPKTLEERVQSLENTVLALTKLVQQLQQNK